MILTSQLASPSNILRQNISVAWDKRCLVSETFAQQTRRNKGPH